MYIPAIALTIALALPGVAAFADQSSPVAPQTVAVQQHDHKANDAKRCCGEAAGDKADAKGCCADGKACGDCCKDGNCAKGCCESGDCSKCSMKSEGANTRGGCCNNGASPEAGQPKGCCGQ